jgi:hypothetical protein
MSDLSEPPTWDGGPRIFRQKGPYPDALATLVDACTYRPGWRVELITCDRGQESVGLTLIITTDTVNSYDHRQPVNVRHLFIVPAAAYDERSWRRWLFDRFVDVETHEAMEFFTIDGEKPFAPDHKPGRDPYTIVERGTWTDADTNFRGERVHPEDSSTVGQHDSGGAG